MRYLRLAPLLYFNLLVAFAFFIGAGLSPKMIIGDVLFITNFTDRGLNLVTWSLSHEMQYYLICPLVFLAFRKVDLRSLALCLGLIAATYYVTRHGFLAHFEYVYAFIAGFFVNILIRLVPLQANEGSKLFGLVLGMAALDIVFNWLSLYGKSAQAGFAAVMISGALVFLMELPGNTALSDRFGFVRRLTQFGMLTGTLTYGIYLWHYMIVRTRSDAVAAYVDRLAAAGRLTLEWQKILVFHLGQVSLVMLLSYTLAWITFHLIEVRFRPGLYRAAADERAPAKPTPAAAEPTAVLASAPANTAAS
jgi:peptidoglycan/LPS O-acetylase OafA/YrhL